MDDAGEGSRVTRRQVLGATAGALAVGALPGRSGAQQASGPTVYVGSSGNFDNNYEDAALYAVDAATGSQEWAFTQPSNQVRSSPTVADGTVYVGSDDGTLYAVDAATGSQEWAFTKPSGVVRSSPTVINSTVYVGSAQSNSDGTLYAVDAATGTEEWAQPSGLVGSSPTVADGTVYVGSAEYDGENVSGTLYAVDAGTGNEEWAFTQPSDWVRSWTVYEGTVYAGSGRLGSDAESTLYAVDAGTGNEKWAFTQPSSLVNSSPTVADGTVYVGYREFDDEEDGMLYAVDADSGSQEWAFEPPASFVVASSPTVADGIVYVGSSGENGSGTLHAVDADSGEQEWAFTQPSDNVRSSPTVYDGIVYAGSGVGTEDGTLYAVDADSGEQEWAFTQPSSGVESSPTVVTDLASGDSVGSRVLLGTLGHHGERADRVTTPAPAFFSVGDLDPQSVTGEPGDSVDVSVTVENLGDLEATQDIVLDVSGLGEVGSESLALAGGESSEVSFTVDTSGVEPGQYTHTVSSDDSASAGALVLEAPPEPAEFSIIAISPSEVTGGLQSGDELVVEATVQNVGEEKASQDIVLEVSGLGEVSSQSLTLAGGEAGSVSFTLDTSGVDAGDYTHTVSTEDEEFSGSLAIEAPPPEDDSTDNNDSDDDGGSSDGGDTSDDSIDGESPGDGGLGTTEMAAIGGGGTLALLFGAYALMRRADDDGDDSTPERPSEPDTPGRATTAQRGSQSPDSGPGDTIDDLLDDVARTLDSAHQSVDAREYDRALARCERAIDTANEARATAREDAPDRVPDAEAALDDATALREVIQVERDARRRASDTLDTAERALDNAAGALDGGRLDDAFDHLDDARAAVADAGDAVDDHDLPDLADRLAALEQRQERLRQAAEDAITRTPTTIPTTPRRSLPYDAIEKGDPIGSGGNADVYHATAATDDGTVELALKEPRMSGTLTIETAERMMQEAETWQQLDDHDHIVSVVDYDSEPLPWIAMEYMDGGHLGERTAEFDFDQALWTAIATTRAVRHAHRRGVAHLDLKPENILFRRVADAWDAPKVADWGLSKHLLDHSKSVEGMTVEYAAPEQFDDEYGTVDDITDVYQLGAVFYKLFTGQPPFEGKPFKVMNRIQNEEPDPPSAVADVPAELDEILLRAMATQKQDRYEDVLLLRNDLQTLSEEIAGGF